MFLFDELIGEIFVNHKVDCISQKMIENKKRYKKTAINANFSFVERVTHQWFVTLCLENACFYPKTIKKHEDVM